MAALQKQQDQPHPFLQRNTIDASPLDDISIHDYDFVDDRNSSNIFQLDPFFKDPRILQMDYARKATYKNLGRPSSSPQLESDNAADLIATLDIEVFEQLRHKGLLLVDASGEYLLMTHYNGSGILNLLEEIVTLKRTYLEQSRKAMKRNGLSSGVADGRIINVEGYLADHHFSYPAKKHEFLQTLEEITQNLFERIKEA